MKVATSSRKSRAGEEEGQETNRVPAMRKVSKIAFAYASLVAHLHLTHIHTCRLREIDKEGERERQSEGRT